MSEDGCDTADKIDFTGGSERLEDFWKGSVGVLVQYVVHAIKPVAKKENEEELKYDYLNK